MNDVNLLDIADFTPACSSERAGRLDTRSAESHQ
jgi:hypothetical protein